MTSLRIVIHHELRIELLEVSRVGNTDVRKALKRASDILHPLDIDFMCDVIA